MRANHAAVSEYPRLGSYQLICEVGYGGMGCVFLAEEVESSDRRRVAIKRIHPHLARKQAFIAMFLDEARLAAAMKHPNVAEVFELGEENETYFYAMEYLHGEHLGALRSKVGQMNEVHVGRIASLTARGLHHAHELCGEDGRALSLVHRDVTPQNIFVTYDGEIKVTDFGIARAEGRLAQTTDTGRLKGKCAYMSPEQVMSLPVDRRADIFSLGVVMWELVTGERLFVARSDAETLLKIADDNITLPRQRAEVSPEFEAIVMRALAYRREERFSTAEELADAIDAHLASKSKGEDPSTALASLMSEHFAETKSEKERTEREHFERRDAQRSHADTLQDRGREEQADDADTVMDAKVAAAIAVQHVADMQSQSSPGPISKEDWPSIDPGATKRPGQTTLMWAALFATVVIIAVMVGASWGAQSATVDSGTVRIATVPSGATVHLDGEQGSLTTPVVISDLPPGRHRLALSLPGFERLEVTFDIDRPHMELEYHLGSPAQETSTTESTGSAEGVSESEELPE